MSIASCESLTMFCSGYPGAPEVLPSHPLIEQSPGYGHPYLPSEDTDIEVDHFLWTGDISSDEVTADQSEAADEAGTGFSVTQKIYPGYPVVSASSTSVLVTRSVIINTMLMMLMMMMMMMMMLMMMLIMMINIIPGQEQSIRV